MFPTRIALRQAQLVGTTLVWNDDDAADDWVPVVVDGLYDISTIDNGRFTETVGFKLNGIGPDQVANPLDNKNLMVDWRH